MKRGWGQKAAKVEGTAVRAHSGLSFLILTLHAANRPWSCRGHRAGAGLVYAENEIRVRAAGEWQEATRGVPVARVACREAFLPNHIVALNLQAKSKRQHGGHRASRAKPAYISAHPAHAHPCGPAHKHP